jgi:hypothetical protein
MVRKKKEQAFFKFSYVASKFCKKTFHEFASMFLPFEKAKEGGKN